MGSDVSEEITHMNYLLSVRNHFTIRFQGLLFVFFQFSCPYWDMEVGSFTQNWVIRCTSILWQMEKEIKYETSETVILDGLHTWNNEKELIHQCCISEIQVTNTNFQTQNKTGGTSFLPDYYCFSWVGLFEEELQNKDKNDKRPASYRERSGLFWF